MKSFYRNEISKARLPGRLIQRAIGSESFSPSPSLTIGFAHYNIESGPMEPHRHGEEAIYILDSRYGGPSTGRRRTDCLTG